MERPDDALQDPLREAQKAAYRYGLTPEQFWTLTPHETYCWIEGRVEADKSGHRENAWLAWHIACFSRQKRLPSLRSIMDKLDAKKQQTSADMLKAAEYITAAFGGRDLRKKKTEEADSGV